MKVAIVGSRQYTNKRKVQEFIWKLKEKFGESLEVVSGGQKDGADGYVKKYALEFEVKYSEFPPSHYSHNIHCILPKFRYNKLITIYLYMYIWSKYYGERKTNLCKVINRFI